MDFEEMLQPAMGYVNDARCILDTVAVQTGGMTERAIASVLSCLGEATAPVHGALNELESWLSYEEFEEP
ncbi:hypothetical protein [Desulfosoma caldarium]|nr:hypothetical protein [Desulfosoma caldarium]